jgi:hypothetical protein
MQACLNREHERNIKDCAKYPLFAAFIAVLVVFTVVFVAIGSLCVVMWVCPGPMDLVFLSLGISLILFFVVFVIVPYTLRFLLNCCFPSSIEEAGPPDEAFVSYNTLYERRPRSKSKTKVRVVEELV